MPLLPRQRCPAKTVSVWRWYATWPDQKGREGYTLPSVSTFSTKGRALTLACSNFNHTWGCTLPETPTNAKRKAPLDSSQRSAFLLEFRTHREKEYHRTHGECTGILRHLERCSCGSSLTRKRY
jgi:hypothetical protein